MHRKCTYNWPQRHQRTFAIQRRCAFVWEQHRWSLVSSASASTSSQLSSSRPPTCLTDSRMSATEYGAERWQAFYRFHCIQFKRSHEPHANGCLSDRNLILPIDPQIFILMLKMAIPFSQPIQLGVGVMAKSHYKWSVIQSIVCLLDFDIRLRIL